MPPANAAIPSAPRALAAALAGTTGELRRALAAWDGTAVPPEDVTLLALYQQRIYRRLSTAPSLAARVVPLLPASVRGEARDTLAARRALLTLTPPKGTPLPKIRIGTAEPAATLRRHYDAAQRRFGVGWHVLAAVNFVESAFGRLRNASYAGARGPMQFIPSTWRAYGLGGDIDDPRDAIFGAANYLKASGAPRNYRRALFAYNHSTAYVNAVMYYANRMRRDPRTFLAYYSWQVYVRTATGVRRVTGPRASAHTPESTAAATAKR